VKTVSDKVVRYFWSNYLCKWLVGGDSSNWNFGSEWPRWSEIADFLSIFARSTSAI